MAAPITVDGIDFRRNGKRWVYRGATNFLLLLRYLLGEDITPALYPEVSVHVVLGLARWIPEQIGYRSLTVDDARYYESLDEFTEWMAGRGLDVEFCVFADVQHLNLSLEWCQRHWARILEVLGQKSNVLIRLVNEPWNNGINPLDFSHPRQVVTPLNRGDLLDHQLGPSADHWDWCSTHPRRDFPKMIKNCQMADVVYWMRKPIVINEPFKAAEIPEIDKSYVEPRYFFQAGRLMSAFNGGAFHSVDGVYSRPLGPIQERCRAAFFAGLNTFQFLNASDWRGGDEWE